MRPDGVFVRPLARRHARIARAQRTSKRAADPSSQFKEGAHDGEPVRARRGASVTRTVAVLVSLATGLSGCYVVSPNAYPPPPYAPPVAPAPGPYRPGGAATSPAPPTTSPGPPQGSGQGCQTITVEAHSETIVRPNGARETVWVPAHQQHVCR
jgi:hypothetical protein